MSNNDKLGVTSNAPPSSVPQKVKISEFGCINCLWNSCECSRGSMFKLTPKGECENYTYYD
ncbi:hypothetical protein LCGC14_1016040 [marine sediment metagenome]|uniref:Uncharacterized protein n=1 Tax=marine sediment metagenome TaxID=412755 RepID=A0A0F9MYT3_9ZZZZ